MRRPLPPAAAPKPHPLLLRSTAAQAAKWDQAAQRAGLTRHRWLLALADAAAADPALAAQLLGR